MVAVGAGGLVVFWWHAVAGFGLDLPIRVDVKLIAYALQPSHLVHRMPCGEVCQVANFTGKVARVI